AHGPGTGRSVHGWRDHRAPPEVSGGAIAAGGTLRVVMPTPPVPFPLSNLTGDVPGALDPQIDAVPDALELFQCCLLRTLLSYNGQPTDEGGTQPRPDLADGMPDISPDGLTWTFHLKSGIRYAPPLSDVEVT